MANVIYVLPSRQKYGVVGVGFRQGKVTSVQAAVSDGDTISAHPHDNLPIRFLGVDAPETKYPLGTSPAFIRLDDAQWVQFLSTTALTQTFTPPLSTALAAYLLPKVIGAAGTNHRYHAEQAEAALVKEVEKDIAATQQALGITEPEARDQFRFHLAFAHDVMDGFGRLLCYINVKQETKPRPEFYQERLLKEGTVAPFFMWPNIDPFISLERVTGTLRDAVPTPATMATLDAKAPSLARSRQYVRDARQNGKGIFDPANPLILEPFEIRYLARGHMTRRWVIDLSATQTTDTNYGTLIEPQNYFALLPEDRLFLPEEYVPLFVDMGWKKEVGAAVGVGVGVGPGGP